MGSEMCIRDRVTFFKELYRERQAIVEHPFGTIKRGWGYDCTLLKTQPKVSGEFGIIFTIYNIRRAITIFGVAELVKRLKEACAVYFLVNMVDLGAIWRRINFRRKVVFLGI